MYYMFFFIQLNVLCPTVYCYCFVVYFYVIWPQLVMFLNVNMSQDLRQIKIKLINKQINNATGKVTTETTRKIP